MTIASVLIASAYREGNLISVGGSPTTAEAAEALTLLNNFIGALFGTELGEHLSDWLVPAPQRTGTVAARFPLLPATNDPPSEVYLYPPGNSRIISHITTATTVYFPEQPNDGARMGFVQRGATATITLSGNGKTIEAATTKAILAATLTPLKWLYRADTGNWVALATLVSSDESPLPVEFDDLLICGLNIRLAPRNGKDPLNATVARYTDMLKKLKTRYKQPTAAAGSGGDIPGTAQTYGGGFGDGFNPLSS